MDIAMGPSIEQHAWGLISRCIITLTGYAVQFRSAALSVTGNGQHTVDRLQGRPVSCSDITWDWKMESMPP